MDVGDVWFKQDGATSHKSQVNDCFATTLPSTPHLLERRSALAPFDYFLWAYLNSIVLWHRTTLRTAFDNKLVEMMNKTPELDQRIVLALTVAICLMYLKLREHKLYKLYLKLLKELYCICITFSFIDFQNKQFVLPHSVLFRNKSHSELKLKKPINTETWDEAWRTVRSTCWLMQIWQYRDFCYQ